MCCTNNLRLVIFPLLFYVHQTWASKLIVSTAKEINYSRPIDNNVVTGDVPNIFTFIMMNDSPKNQVSPQKVLKKVARNAPKSNSKSDDDDDDSDDDDKSDATDNNDDNGKNNDNCINNGNCDNNDNPYNNDIANYNDNANNDDDDNDDDDDSEDDHEKNDRKKVSENAVKYNNKYSGVVDKLQIAKTPNVSKINKTVSRQRNILRSIWSACSKKAAKICKKACVSTSKNVCSIHKCSKKLKKAIKRSCKSICKSKFISEKDDD